MRVAFLLYGVPQNGGTKVVFRVGDLLQKRGYEVVYYVASPRGELPFPSDCEFVFAPRYYPNAIGRVAWLSRIPIKADTAVATFHPTAVALHCNPTAPKRKLYYVQAYEPEFYSDSMLHFAKRWPMLMMAGASYLLPLHPIVNCDGSRKGLPFKSRNTAAEIPPGIDLALYRPRPHANATLVVGHISRREEWKGSDYFFRAMKKMRMGGHEFSLRIAYDLWPETHGLEYERVTPRNETELAEYYASVDVLVSSVTQRGFGYPPLEAMATGALCVSTPMDFGKPWVDHIPILAKSSDSIVHAMKEVFGLKDRQNFVEAGLQTAAAYDWSRIADRWCEVLEHEKA